MATHALDVTDVLMPTNANATWQSTEAVHTNKRYARMVLVFNNTSTRDDASGEFTVPENYVGTPTFVVEFGTPATSGGVVWVAAYKGVAAAASLDPSTDDEGTISATVAANATANVRLTATLTPATPSNFAAGRLIQFKIGRNGASGSDTAAATAYIERVLFKYADA